MRGFRNALLAAGVLAMPLAAYAQPVTGFYVGGGMGYNLPENPPLSTGGYISPQGGFVGLASVGYGLGNGLRFELEGSYRSDSDSPLATRFVANNSGSVQKFGVMANALYDFDLGIPWLNPYVGFGAGYAWTKTTRQRNYTAANFPYLYQTADNTSGSLALQAIGGLAFPIRAVPGLSLTAEYRFFAIPLAETLTYTDVVAGGPAITGTTRVQHQYDHSFLLGIRYAFGVAPPPPAPAPMAAPAPAPSRSYLVFFDWDKATLTARAQQIIHEAADNSTKVQYTRIEVNGYTDTSGTPQYNQGLSVRRAQAVAAELVKDGVPKSAIAIQGFGETHLLVPTGPGVREPQNRRVEIIIH